MIGDNSTDLTALNEYKLQLQLLAYSYKTCEIDFHEFVRQAWPIVEPGTTFQSNWHIRSICKHLEAVADGRIKRLIIMVPPRMCKSTLVSVMFPPWVWANRPHARFLTVSNAIDLATILATKSKRIIDSEWYSLPWTCHCKGSCKCSKFNLSSEQNTKSNYENTKLGARVALGIGSKVTGKGGDFLLIDDPHEASEAMSLSPANRQSVIDSYNQGLTTRLNDPKESSIVLIMQRLHPEDLIGEIIASDEDGTWDYLIFPNRFEEDNVCTTSLGVQDPRTEENQLLWPERFDMKWTEEQEKLLDVWGAAAQLQQRPAPRGGLIINVDNFKRHRKLPPEEEIIDTIQVWDTAQKAKEINDAWVCGTWVVTKNRYYLVDVLKQRMTYPEGKDMVKLKYQQYQPSVVLIEDKSTGSSLLQELPEEGIPALGVTPVTDKVTRMSVENASIKAGLVSIPLDEPWVRAYLTELASFPGGRFDDQVDMTSASINWMRTNSGIGTVPIFIPGEIQEDKPLTDEEQFKNVRKDIFKHYKGYYRI